MQNDGMVMNNSMHQPQDMNTMNMNGGMGMMNMMGGMPFDQQMNFQNLYMQMLQANANNAMNGNGQDMNNPAMIPNMMQSMMMGANMQPNGM